jgi:hypothetical protein
MPGDFDKQGRPPGIGEFLFNEIRSAFQDIRQKVLEEGWFGRVVTPAPVVEMDRAPAERSDREPGRELGAHEQERRPTFDELWAPVDRTDPSRDIEQEHGIDR